MSSIRPFGPPRPRLAMRASKTPIKRQPERLTASVPQGREPAGRTASTAPRPRTPTKPPNARAPTERNMAKWYDLPMAVDKKFILTGAKRVVDSRPMYAQVVVTDDCNLTCSYCDEYTP